MNKIVVCLLTVLIFSPFAVSQQQTKPDPNTEEEILPDALIKRSDIANSGDEVSDELMRQWIFEQMKQQRNPLTPSQQRQLIEIERKKIEASKRNKAARAITEIIPVTLKPGEKISDVYVTPGWDTHINFIDGSGAPWPITYVSGGSEEDFPTQEVTQGTGESATSNVVKVRSTFRVGSTNLTVMLDGLSEILNITIVADKNVYHPVATMQLQGFGPNARTLPSAQIAPVSYDPELKLVLQGGAGLPPSFKRIKSSSDNVEAWHDTSSDELFILTNYTLSSPRALGMHPGTGGFTAYRTKYLPVVLFSNDNGFEISVTLAKD